MQFHDHAAALLSRLPSYLLVGFVAGGALRSHFDGTEVKDIDVFFHSEDDWQFAVAQAAGDPSMQYVSDVGRTVYYMRDGVQINLVGFAFGSPAATIERFDFRCCRMAVWIDEFTKAPTWVMDDLAAVDAVKRRLVVLQNNGAERTERRIQHYIDDYGYRLDLSWTDHLVPEDQVEDQDPPRPVAVTEVQRYLRRVPRCNSGGY